MRKKEREREITENCDSCEASNYFFWATECTEYNICTTNNDEFVWMTASRGDCVYVICNAIAASPDRDHDKTKNEWSEKMIIIIMLPHTPKKNIHRFVVWSARAYFQIAVTCYSFSLRSWNKIRTSASECLCVFSMYHGNMTTWRHTYIHIYIYTKRKNHSGCTWKIGRIAFEWEMRKYASMQQNEMITSSEYYKLLAWHKSLSRSTQLQFMH